MHEVSLVIGLVGQLEAIAAEHGATRVRRFVLEVGALSNVVPDLLKDAVDIVGQDVELLRGAQCVVDAVAFALHCESCGVSSEPERFAFSCPECGSLAVRTERGDELLLRNVELEIPSGHETNA